MAAAPGACLLRPTVTRSAIGRAQEGAQRRAKSSAATATRSQHGTTAAAPHAFCASPDRLAHGGCTGGLQTALSSMHTG